MTKPITIVELFSGLGSQAKALVNIGADFVIEGICEWDIHAMVAYDVLHKGGEVLASVKKMNKEQLLEKLSEHQLSHNSKAPIKERTLKALPQDVLMRIYSAILNTKNFVNIKELKGEALPDELDILTYSFPCQDLSCVGHFHGYNKGIDRDSGSRSSLLWEVERILKERVEAKRDLPRVLILENVTALLSKRHKENFEQWQSQLRGFGYTNKIYSLNSLDFGSPQNRLRLIMISIKTDKSQSKQKWVANYFSYHCLDSGEYRKTLKLKETTVKECLRLDPTNDIYFLEAKHSQPNATESRLKIWDNNIKIVDYDGTIKDSVATITTKQDRHPNSGNIYFDYDGNTKSKYRFLSPRECFCLMGFSEADYNKILDNNLIVREGLEFFTRDNLLRMAGNSIAVQVLEQVFRQVVDILEFLDKTT